jgi:hypothetical protein
MIKISTLYKKDPSNLALVINEVNPGNEWAINGEGFATRKWDGTAAAMIDGLLYKRYDVKKGRKVPLNAIPCQEPDAITGHWPHWVLVDYLNPDDKYFVEALNNQLFEGFTDGTYELCGPKVNGNPERKASHVLIKHDMSDITLHYPLDFERLKRLLSLIDVEGIVFHHKTDGRMCKIRKSDFGIKREVAVHHSLASE